MGLQAAATRGVAPGRSTNYLTGTLTGIPSREALLTG